MADREAFNAIRWFLGLVIEWKVLRWEVWEDKIFRGLYTRSVQKVSRHVIKKIKTFIE